MSPILARAKYWCVFIYDGHPYMRGRMMDRRSYVPPFQIGER